MFFLFSFYSPILMNVDKGRSESDEMMGASGLEEIQFWVMADVESLIVDSLLHHKGATMGSLMGELNQLLPTGIIWCWAPTPCSDHFEKNTFTILSHTDYYYFKWLHAVDCGEKKNRLNNRADSILVL